MTVQTQDTGKAVSAVIAQSWHRCSKFMQRETWQTPHQAQGLTFDSICRRKTALLTIGQAALEDAWEFMDGRPCALILDETACILSRCGEPQTLAQLADLGFRDGSYCAESIIGTCALSLAAMQGSRSTPPAIGILSRPCSHGAFVRRRCSITTGACSALSRFAVWWSTSPAPTFP
jgi:transcriptional activator for dhaKLM operon